MFPGLVRYDEIAAGEIRHALRFTTHHTKTGPHGSFFVSPATHGAGDNWGTHNIMGMRLRLKAQFDISGFSETNKIILTALKKYGMFLADNGSNMFIQGAPDDRWNDADLRKLRTVDASAFEVVHMGIIYETDNVLTGRAPDIQHFDASAKTIAPNTPVTLTWLAADGSYTFIDPVGPVRGRSVTVRPAATTTYALHSSNQYGRSKMVLTITVRWYKLATGQLSETPAG